MDELLQRIRECGLDTRNYAPEELLGEGGYSVVFVHLDPSLALKVTTCPVSIALLSRLMLAPREDFVRVLDKVELGHLGPSAPATAFVVERLDLPAPDACSEVAPAAIAAAKLARAGAARAPRRNTPEYIAFNVRYCRGLAAEDPARREAWEFLADFVEELANPRLSVDVLTEGNLLARSGTLVVSDPIRQVWYP